MSRSVIAALAFLVPISAAQSQILSAPPAIPARAAAATKSVPAALLLPESAVARRITLAVPTAAETDSARAKSASAGAGGKVSSKRSRAVVGFARVLPSTEQQVPVSALRWHDLANGMQAARITVNSPGAGALRIGLSLALPPPGLTLRFRGSASGAAVQGPIDAAHIAADAVYWSPLLDGDTAVVELALPQGVSLAGATIGLPMLSHLALNSTTLKQADPLDNIGQSAACEVDVACIAAPLKQQAATAINATARILLVDRGNSYLCSGTLLNDSATSLTPYFYTANHCLEDDNGDFAAAKGNPAAVARSFQTYWLFQSSTCGADTSANVNFSTLTSGTTLLARGVDYDWALVKLNDATPPPGVTFAAWNGSGILATGAAANGIHHPEGDLKKFSQGTVSDYQTYDDGSSFIQMVWSSGATEPGSSGSGLFTLDASKTFLELRGGLWGGTSSCTKPQGVDDYSRLDVALPLLAPYLTPGATSAAKTTPTVEFYNATLDDYFITASPLEIQALDNGTFPGWVRTGLRFLAYTDPAVAPAGAQPVCRYYVAPTYGDSHFYSASPAECAEVGRKFAAQWVFESASVFYILLPNPTTGACPAGSRGVYRFMNIANGLHHRYTAEVDVRDSIIADGGWTQEGYGTPPNAPVMCTPTS
jgi:lysyl endopeptidase